VKSYKPFYFNFKSATALVFTSFLFISPVQWKALSINILFEISNQPRTAFIFSDACQNLLSRRQKKRKLFDGTHKHSKTDTRKHVMHANWVWMGWVSALDPWHRVASGGPRWPGVALFILRPSELSRTALIIQRKHCAFLNHLQIKHQHLFTLEITVILQEPSLLLKRFPSIKIVFA